jgi:type III secretory pathway component EscR
MYHINKISSDKLLNKRMNDTQKTKKEYKFKYSIINEDILIKKIDKMLEIKDNITERRFIIRYTQNKKHVFIRKRYNETNKEEVRRQMEGEQTRIRNAFNLTQDLP